MKIVNLLLPAIFVLGGASHLVALQKQYKIIGKGSLVSTERTWFCDGVKDCQDAEEDYVDVMNKTIKRMS